MFSYFFGIEPFQHPQLTSSYTRDDPEKNSYDNNLNNYDKYYHIMHQQLNIFTSFRLSDGQINAIACVVMLCFVPSNAAAAQRLDT